jgi:septation ring formation regulator EzrA
MLADFVFEIGPGLAAVLGAALAMIPSLLASWFAYRSAVRRAESVEVKLEASEAKSAGTLEEIRKDVNSASDKMSSELKASREEYAKAREEIATLQTLLASKPGGS